MVPNWDSSEYLTLHMFNHCSSLFVQWSHYCHDDQSGGFPYIRAPLHVVVWSPQEDLGRVELGVYDGLVALHKAGHPWPAHGGL